MRENIQSVAAGKDDVVVDGEDPGQLLNDERRRKISGECLRKGSCN